MQWRPISSYEIDTYDPASLRTVRHLAEAVNNFHAEVMGKHIRSQICWPGWYSPDTNTNEYVVAIFGKVEIPDGYSKLRWAIGHIRSAGTGTITWRLRTPNSPEIYKGYQDGFDGFFSTEDTVSSIVTSLSTHQVDSATLDIYTSARQPDLTLVLTAQNSDVTTRGYITAITMSLVP